MTSGSDGSDGGRGEGGGGAGHDRPARQPRHLDVVFGLTALVAFGSWFYGFGVLVDPLARDGIGEAVTAPTYGAMLLLAGVGSLLAGRLLDRGTGRWLFAVGAPVVALGTLATIVAGRAGQPWAFAVAAVVTGGTVGGLGHYSLLHATIVALHPEDRTRAVTVNTLWGAFASPVFLPVMALLVERWSWPVALVVANATVVLAFVAMAVVMPPTAPVADGTNGAERAQRVSAKLPERSSARAGDGVDPAGAPTPGPWSPQLRPLLLVAAGGGGAATSVLLLYQVPAMVDAGLALTVASTLAGVRGAAQVAGRLPLPPLLRRFGTGRAMVVSLGLLAVAALLLTGAGTVPMAIAFVVVGGLAVGALTTVENLFVTDALGATTVGAALGAVSVARGVGGALGPTVAGFATTWRGNRDLALVGVAVVAVVTTAVVAAVMRRRPATRPPADGPAVSGPGPGGRPGPGRHG